MTISLKEGDTMSRLPKQAAAKYAEMADATEDAQNYVLSIQRRVKETENQIRINPASEAEIGPELSRQRARMSQEQARFLALARVDTAIRTWLTQLSPGVELRDAAPEMHKLVKGDTCVEAVRQLRAEIDKLMGARASVARAVLPIADLRAQADRHVDALAARGKPTVTVDRDQLRVRHNVEGYASEAIVLLAWLFPDQMRAKLHEQIDGIRQDEVKRQLPVMPSAERAAKLAELDGRILALERKEECFISRAAVEGTTIPRRENANPAAILGVVVAEKRAAVAVA
jgi:hypothetical protein